MYYMLHNYTGTFMSITTLFDYTSKLKSFIFKIPTSDINKISFSALIFSDSLAVTLISVFL